MSRKILMLAGPNGAGKTTLAKKLITHSTDYYDFVNADEIARGLSPMHPEHVALAAGKLMLLRMQELLKAGKSFAFETTASGVNYVKHLKQAQTNGYDVELVFLWLATECQAVERVAQRVQQGGHYVPKEAIVRRYHAGLRNLFAHYLPLSDRAVVMDNSGERERVLDMEAGSLREAVLQARKLACQAALETAVRTGTCLILFEDGKTVKEKPQYEYKLVPIKSSRKRRKK